MAEANTPRWAVTNQLQTQGQAPGGLYVPGMEVTFTLANGQSGSVFVPIADYTEAKVQQAIEARAAVMMAVAGLSG